MKKYLLTILSILFAISFNSMVYANPVISTITNNGLEKIMINSLSSSEYGYYHLIDHNPTSYHKHEVNGHILESWIKNNIAYTAFDGKIVKATKRNL